MPTFVVETYGCQMNVHDSERIAGLLARMEVDRVQGYLFGRAMAADQIHSWVHKHGLG